jgi:hypothetical protein
MRVRQSTTTTRDGSQHHFDMFGANIIGSNQSTIACFMMIGRRVWLNARLLDQIF